MILDAVSWHAKGQREAGQWVRVRQGQIRLARSCQFSPPTNSVPRVARTYGNLSDFTRLNVQPGNLAESANLSAVSKLESISIASMNASTASCPRVEIQRNAVNAKRQFLKARWYGLPFFGKIVWVAVADRRNVERCLALWQMTASLRLLNR